MESKYIKSSKVTKVKGEEGIVVVELTIDMKSFVEDVIKCFKIPLEMIGRYARDTEGGG